MPTFVRAASVLMWLVWIGGVTYGVTTWLLAVRLGASAYVALGCGYLLVFILLALLIRAVMKGRQWARITYTVLAILAVAAIAPNLFAGVSTSAGSKLIGGALIVTYTAIVVLLFHSTSNPWFKKRDAS